MTSSFLNIARQGKNGWLRYVAGILLMFVSAIVVVAPVLIGSLLVSGNPLETLEALEGQQFVSTLIDSNPVLGFGFMGLTGFALTVGLYLAVTRIHGRPFLTLVTPDTAIGWQRICQGFGLWLGLWALSFALRYGISPASYRFSFNASEWLPLALLAILIIPVIATLHVLFIYGYLFQGIGLIIRHPLILSMASALVWAGLAFDLEEPAWMMVNIPYAMFLFWVVIRDNRSELVIGIAIAHQLINLLLVSFSESSFRSVPLFAADSLPSVGWSFLSLSLRAGIFYFVLLRSKPQSLNHQTHGNPT